MHISLVKLRGKILLIPLTRLERVFGKGMLNKYGRVFVEDTDAASMLIVCYVFLIVYIAFLNIS